MSTAQYVLRVRQPDGSWKFDMDCLMRKRDAEYQSKQNRILLGVLCQVWTEKEAADIVAKTEAAEIGKHSAPSDSGREG